MIKLQNSTRRSRLAWLGVVLLASMACAQYTRMLPDRHGEMTFMREAAAVVPADDGVPAAGPTPADLAVYLELHQTRDMPEVAAAPLAACR